MMLLCRSRIPELARSHDQRRGGSLEREALRRRRYHNIITPCDIARLIAALTERLAALDRERSEIAEQLGTLQRAQAEEAAKPALRASASVTMASPNTDKIALFRSLFRGREEMFPRRWENINTGKAATRRSAGTSGSGVSVTNRGSNAESARIRRSSPSATTLSDPT
jgi:hypothetical protein